MSDTDTAVTLTTDGVAVEKTYEPDEFPVQVLSFEVRSDRDDPVTLRLVDHVPDAVAAADLGFNPNYGGDHWSTENGNAVFEREIDPNEEFRTVYAIRDTDIDPAAFMTEPTLDVEGAEQAHAATTATDTESESGARNDETPERDSSQAARDVITGDAPVSGLERDEDGVEAVDLSGSGGTAEPTGSTTEESTAEAAPTVDDATSNDAASDNTSTTLPEGGVGAALAAELRDGGLDEADRKLLADELTENDAGNEVRVSHLQSRISDLEAYTDALEDFIDENGSARQLIEDMTERLDTIESDIEALDERTTATETAIERLDDHTERNAEDIEALDKGIADTNSEVAETQESLAELREDVETIDEWRDRISSVLGGISASDEED